MLTGLNLMARILLIDDNEQVRDMIGELLRTEGFEVEVASDGAEGLKAFRNKKADLVITDVVMPEKEGLEVIAEIKQMAPETKLIAVSGGGYSQNLGYLAIAERLGAHRTVSKPFKMDEFIKTVRSVLGMD